VSFRVLVIPEDPTNNGYILKPLVEALLADAGKPNGRVQILTSPRLKGYDEAVAAIREELPERYGFWDLWIFMPDADRASEAAMQSLETDLAAKNIRLLCCAAQPEVEIYACVAHRGKLGAQWTEVRRHPRMKETFFDPLLASEGDARRAGGGRDQLIAASLRPLRALLQLCPELQTLRDRIAEFGLD
jgi:hypothetical protein